MGTAGATTGRPSASSSGMTAAKLDASAKAPWTRTTVGWVSGMIVLHLYRDGSRAGRGRGREWLLVVQGGAEELAALGGGGLRGVGVAQGVDHHEVVDDALVADRGNRDAGGAELG